MLLLRSGRSKVVTTGIRKLLSFFSLCGRHETRKNFSAFVSLLSFKLGKEMYSITTLALAPDIDLKRQ